MALWWTRRPCRSYGTEIIVPCIVSCDISIDDKDVLDLRKLSDYKEFAEIYKSEFAGQYGKKHISSEILSVTKLRCVYCDFLKYYLNLKAIISNFSPSFQPYLDDNCGIYFKDFDIVYTETQMCVFDQSIIKEKSIEYCEAAREV